MPFSEKGARVELSLVVGVLERPQAHVTIVGDQVTTNEIAGNLMVEHMMVAG